jgi:hypothetical protein
MEHAPAPTAEKRVDEKLEFRTHLLVYLSVNFVIFMIWLIIALTSGGSAWWPWFLFPLLGWGIGIVMHGWSVYGPSNSGKRDELIAREMEKMKQEKKK